MEDIMHSDMGPSTSELLQNRQEFRHPHKQLDLVADGQVFPPLLF